MWKQSVKVVSGSNEPTENSQPNLQLPAALRSFIVFSSLFICPAATSLFSPQKAAVFSEKALKTHWTLPIQQQTAGDKLCLEHFALHMHMETIQNMTQGFICKLLFWWEVNLQETDHAVKHVFNMHLSISNERLQMECILVTCCASVLNSALLMDLSGNQLVTEVRGQQY